MTNFSLISNIYDILNAGTVNFAQRGKELDGNNIS